MRRAVVATASVAGATVGLTLVLNGLAGGPEGPGTFRPPAASAAALTPFDGCEALVDWYVDRALPHVGPYGLQNPQIDLVGRDTWRSAVPDMAAAEMADAAGSVGADSAEAQSSSETGTNVQEVGVDEPDVAKTDGRLVVRVERGELVVTDVRTDDPRELSRLDLPADMHSPELLLSGDTVLVLQSATSYGGPVPGEPVEPLEPMPMPDAPDRSVVGPWPVAERSRLVEVSLTDPTDPQIMSEQSFGGVAVTARQYEEDGGTTVRLVLRTDQPVLDWVQPHRNRTASEAKQENKDILRASTAEDWLPTVGEGDDRRPLVECSDVAHPRTPDAGLGTLTVVSLPVQDPTSWRSVGVTASAATVYSSTDRLYVAAPGERNTQVHAFELQDGAATYTASGEVEGSLRDRWSMDEHDGVLRVAVAHVESWSPSENGITTLRESGDELVEVGSVRGLGPDEEIKSVRWFDDLAVVVTFRQTDPLYTVDLSDPARPRTLGALKIPGFSSYLHPIGDDRLLGIGQDASLEGMTRGAQAAIFDIRDLTDPRRLSTDFLGAHTSAVAEHDPRGFTWLPGSATALTAVTDQWHGGIDLLALEVGRDGKLATVDSWSLPPWDAGSVRTLPLGGTRVALVSDEVQVIDVGRSIGR